MNIIQATKHGDIVKVKQLLEEGIEIEQKDSDGVTALMMACVQGHTEMVKTLLEHGANINTMNKYGHTPLMCAASRNHIQTAKVLIERGADAQVKTHQGNTALRLVRIQELYNILLLLHKHSDSLHESEKEFLQKRTYRCRFEK